MIYVIYSAVGLTFIAGGVVLGFIIRDKQITQLHSQMLKYRALTPESKRVVDGMIDAKIIRDEETTFRLRIRKSWHDPK